MKLRLDFAHPRPRPAWPAWLLLALGLAAAGGAGWRHQAESARLDQAKARIAALTPKSTRPAPRQGSGGEGRAGAGLASTRALLGADWAGLLDGLETSRPPQVALLSIEAEAGRAGLSLTAEAKDHRVMLAYVEALEALPILDQVALGNHADQEREGEKAVRFSLKARWLSQEVKP